MRSALVFFVLVGFSNSAPTGNKCPYDANYLNGFTGCFMASILPLTFNQSESMCNYMGGHLVSIHDRQANRIVAEVAESDLRYTTIMIGAKRLNSSGNFSNVDGTPFDYDNFVIALPNIQGENLVATIHLGNQTTPFAQWDTVQADTPMPFACHVADCSVQLKNSPICPEGSVYSTILDQCLIGIKRQLLGDQQRTYWSAERSCQKFGGHLVSIHNAFENSEVLRIAQGFNLDDFYIGYSEVRPSNCPWKDDCEEWEWTDGGYSTYTNRIGQFTEGQGKFAVMLMKATDPSLGKWQQILDNRPCTLDYCYGYDWMCALQKYNPSRNCDN